MAVLGEGDHPFYVGQESLPGEGDYGSNRNRLWKDFCV